MGPQAQMSRFAWAEDPLPSFSVVVATHGRPRQLAECLAALASLDYPRDRFEVLIVDDGSPTPLTAVVAPYCERLDLMLVLQERAGAGAARNTGATRAKGTFLAFTEDDCIVSPDWLRALAQRFETAPEHMIGGRVLNGLPDNPYSSASQLLFDYLYAYHNADPADPRFFGTGNLALPTARFREIGGFDTRYIGAGGEDRELCDRWRSLGYRSTYDPDAVVYHRHNLDLPSFWRQQFNYGHGAVAFRRARAARRQSRRLESWRFYLGLLRYPWVSARGRQALVLTLLLTVSQLATVAGVVAELMRGDDRRPPDGDPANSGARL
jgi:GT2 family glycosyltransferase